MIEKRSLTPAQIQYLRMGPKIGNSLAASKQLQENLNQQGSQFSSSLSSIPRYTFGNFEKTVSNFGVLLHRNFVGSSTLHQAQKYGSIAAKMDKYMQQQKEKPSEDKKNSHNKNFSDSRTSIKAIYDFKGNKILMTLHSLSIETVQTHRTVQTLPIVFIRLLVERVSSSKLAKTIEASIRQDGNTINVDYDRIQAKISHSTNSQIKYQQNHYVFDKGGQQLSVNLPYLQIYHSQTQFRQILIIENKDIIDIIDTDFDNVEVIFKKYFDHSKFEQNIGKTGIDKRSLPPNQFQQQGDAGSDLFD